MSQLYRFSVWSPSKQLRMPLDKGVGGRSMYILDGAVAFLVGSLCAIQLSRLPFNVALVDATLIVVGIYAVGYALLRRTCGFGLRYSPRIWLWLILVGSVLGTFAARSVENSVVQILRDAYAFSIFFAVAFWLWMKPHTWRPMVAGLFLVATVCSVMIIVDGGRRPAGTFLNPNYAGSFLAAVLILLLLVGFKVSRWWVLLVPVMGLAILYTASFGALTMLGTAFLAWLWLGRSGGPVVRRLAVTGVLIAAAACALSFGLFGAIGQSDQANEGNLGTDRLAYSSQTRTFIWRSGLELLPEHPLGVGPDAVRNERLVLGGLELHNDPLAYLVERGPIGLVGLVGFGACLWRSSPKRGISRVLMLAFAVSSLTRDVLNFRHLWIILAVALIYDLVGDSELCVTRPGTKRARPGELRYRGIPDSGSGRGRV